MKVKDVMATVVHSCRPHTNLAEAAEIMWTHDCGALPVLDDEGQVIGMLTDRDICMAVATKGRIAAHITVWETITGNVYVCHADDDIKEALKVMGTQKVRRLPVVDDAGRLRGFLSMNDVVLHAEGAKGKMMPELSCDDVVHTLKAICEHRVLVGL